MYRRPAEIRHAELPGRTGIISQVDGKCGAWDIFTRLFTSMLTGIATFANRDNRAMQDVHTRRDVGTLGGLRRFVKQLQVALPDYAAPCIVLLHPSKASVRVEII